MFAAGLPGPLLDALLRVVLAGAEALKGGLRAGARPTGDPRATGLGRGRKRQSSFSLQRSSGNFVPYPTVLKLCNAKLCACIGSVRESSVHNC